MDDIDFARLCVSYDELQRLTAEELLWAYRFWVNVAEEMRLNCGGDFSFIDTQEYREATMNARDLADEHMNRFMASL